MLSPQALQESLEKLRSKLLFLFRHQGYLTYSTIPYQAFKKIINKESLRICSTNFKEPILKDIWEHCDSNNYAEVSIHALAESATEGLRILNDKIFRIEGEGGVLDDRIHILKERRKELKHYKDEGNNRRVHVLQNECKELEEEIEQIQYALHTFKEELRFIFLVLIEPNSHLEFVSHERHKDWKAGRNSQELGMSSESDDVSQNGEEFNEQKSRSLQLLFYFSVLLIKVELLMLAIQLRKSMLTLELATLSIFTILIGCLHHQAVFYLILAFVLSFCLDVLYLLSSALCVTMLSSDFILCPSANSLSLRFKNFSQIHHLTLFLASLAIRCFLMLRWCKFRDTGKIVYFFNFWGRKVMLSRRVKVIVSCNNQWQIGEMSQ